MERPRRSPRKQRYEDDDDEEEERPRRSPKKQRYEDDDEEEVYKLVTSVRGNSLKNYISIESPIGKAIRGAKVGDRVYVKVNENAGYYLEIRAIEKSDDEAEDSIRKY